MRLLVSNLRNGLKTVADTCPSSVSYLVFELQLTLLRDGVVAASVDVKQAADIVNKHSTSPAFRAGGKNYWTVPVDLMWHLVGGAVAAGAFIRERCPMGGWRAHFGAFFAFPVGVTANGDPTYGVKVCVKRAIGGSVDVLTAFPIQDLAGMRACPLTQGS